MKLWKQWLSALCAVVLVISFLAVPATAENTPETNGSDYTRETEQDQPDMEVSSDDLQAASWASNYLNWSQNQSNYYSIQQAGCFIVAMSKMIYEAGVDRSSSFNPDVYAVWEESKGYIKNIGKQGDYNINQIKPGEAPETYAKTKGKTLTYRKAYSSPTSSEIISWAKSGWFTILKGQKTISTSSGNKTIYHYMFVDNAYTISKGAVWIQQSSSDGYYKGRHALSEFSWSITNAYVWQGSSSNFSHTVYLQNNYSGKNYLANTNFAELDSSLFTIRGTTYTLSVDSENSHDGYNSLKIVGNGAGVDMSEDLVIQTLTQGRRADDYASDAKSMTLSFWAKSSVSSAAVSFRWGYAFDSSSSVTLTTSWQKYSVRMDKTNAYSDLMVMLFNKAGTFWISEMQLEDGTTSSSFVAENGGDAGTVTITSGSTYSLPTPTRPGFVFEGWYTAASGGSKISNGTTVTNYHNVFYAHWKKDTANPITLTVSPSETVIGLTSKYGKTLTASFTPSEVTAPDLVWTSSDPSIVSVSNTGFVSGNGKIGGALVTAHSASLDVQASCLVKVVEMADHTRIYGSDRYNTAFAAAAFLQEQKGIDRFASVIVACGSNYPDALAGSYLATVKNAPILLVNSAKVATENNVFDFCKENLVSGGNVYLLGGTGVVSARFETRMKNAGYQVTRLGGSSRYETNMQINDAAGISSGATLLVCSGSNYADALSASYWRSPILLVKYTKGKDGLTSAQKTYLSSIKSKISKIRIIGGTGAVTEETASAIASLMGVTPTRLAGANRYETSAICAEAYLTSRYGTRYRYGRVLLACGNNFPDGLTGGAMASIYSSNMVVLLTKKGSTADAVNFVSNYGRSGISITMGGSKIISDTMIREIMNNSGAVIRVFTK